MTTPAIWLLAQYSRTRTGTCYRLAPKFSRRHGDAVSVVQTKRCTGRRKAALGRLEIPSDGISPSLVSAPAISHCLGIASEVITNAPLHVPTSTTTPLISDSYLCDVPRHNFFASARTLQRRRTFQHFLAPLAMLDIYGRRLLHRLAFGKKPPGRAGLYITVVRRTVQSLQIHCLNHLLLSELRHPTCHFIVFLGADPNSAATILARSGTKVSPTIVQLHRLRGSGVIASSHPIQSGVLRKSSSERKPQ
jgi:hypothetical protein